MESVSNSQKSDSFTTSQTSPVSTFAQSKPVGHKRLYLWLAITGIVLVMALLVVAIQNFAGYEENLVSDTTLTTHQLVKSDVSWKTYRNEEWGFELTFTDGWKGYRAVKEDSTLVIEIPTQNPQLPTGYYPMLFIQRASHEFWNKEQQDDRPAFGYLGENDEYVFIVQASPDLPTDLGDRVINFEKVLKSFRLLNADEVKKSVNSVNLPPDPGESGNKTIIGIDSDSDGVRDDIQRFIELSYQSSEKMREGLKQYTKAVQKVLTAANPEESILAVEEELKSIDCLQFVGINSQQRKSFLAIILNTSARNEAYLKSVSRFGGQTIRLVPEDKMKYQCAFNPDILKN